MKERLDVLMVNRGLAPSREKANLLYQALGFRQHQTNVYKLSL